MKYYIIAGEASGDLHGSNLIHAIKELDSNAEFRVWGGDLMRGKGAVLVKHYKDHSFMGFLPVILNIRTIKQNFKIAERDIASYQPDVVVLIDYSGFNLRLAQRIKKYEFKIYYYIAPQVWAWRQHRVKKIKALIDKMFVILPFEKEFYQKWDYEVSYHGNPTIDAINNSKNTFSEKNEFSTKHNLSNKPIISILPGSRKQEISNMLPTMLKMSFFFPDYQFIIAGISSVDKKLYQKYMPSKSIKIIYDETHELLNNSFAALVTSGTATLETALLNIPQIVCYKTNEFTYRLVKSLVDVKYISLVNLIMDQQIVTELIQKDFNSIQLKAELSKLLNPEIRETILSHYNLLINKLGNTNVSEKVAKAMVASLS